MGLTVQFPFRLPNAFRHPRPTRTSRQRPPHIKRFIKGHEWPRVLIRDLGILLLLEQPSKSEANPEAEIQIGQVEEMVHAEAVDAEQGLRRV